LPLSVILPLIAALNQNGAIGPLPARAFAPKSSQARSTVRQSSPSRTVIHSSADRDDLVAPSRPVRFLGKGPLAPVEPGVVLVAPAHEASHFLMKAAVFVHAVGVDPVDGERVIRGVIIDHPTAFTMGEMGGGSVVGSLAHNILFRGGDAGNDSAMLLHSCGGLVMCGPMIGTSGIYEGGLASATELVEDDLADPECFKFFFNYVEFTERQMEEMLREVDSEGDAWVSVEAPPNLVLDGDYNRGEAWKYIRNQLTQLGV